MMNRILIIAAFCMLAACKPSAAPPSGASEPANPPQRFAWVTGLNPEKADYYEKLHADPWPAVLKNITDCNIRNYSIYKREIDGKFYLFSYLEYIGDDFDADMKKMAADPEVRRWWKETDPCQLPLPDAVAKGGMWSDVEEVFHHP